MNEFILLVFGTMELQTRRGVFFMNSLCESRSPLPSSFIQLDVGGARIPYTDISTQQPRAAYQLSSNTEQLMYIASQGLGDCARGQKVFDYQVVDD